MGWGIMTDERNRHRVSHFQAFSAVFVSLYAEDYTGLREDVPPSPVAVLCSTNNMLTS